jgi:diphthamide biosynthesis protein 3
MASVYDEVEIEDMDWKEENKTFYYACPCGDKFFITLVSRRGAIKTN